MNSNAPQREQPIFSALIKIHYDQRFLLVARNFVENLSEVAGADQEEAAKLALLVEECLVFIIEKYVDRRLDAYIELCCMLLSGNRILIEITDVGPPIHESRIPDFNIDDELSVTGLWYKLVSQMADDFSFINRHSGGWLIRLEKCIKASTFANNENQRFEDLEEAGAEEAESLAAGKLGDDEKTVRLATPDDVEKLIDQAYFTYRYSYADDFYDNEKLKELIEKNLYEITVLETRGKFVGAYVIKYPESGEKWAEIGSAMLLPEYRLGTAGRILFRSLIAYLVENPRDCDFYVSHNVTGHTRSQRGLERAHRGFKPLFLFLNMVPRPDFIGIKRASEESSRESLLHCFHLNKDLSVKTLYVPACVQPIVRNLTREFSRTLDIVTETAEPVAQQSVISSYQVGHAGFAVINVEVIGQDRFSRLHQLVISMVSSGIESINVNIATAAPLPERLDEELAAMNLVFCGVSLRSLSHLDLAYCLTVKPVDFNHIKVSHAVAGELLEYIKDGYAKRDRIEPATKADHAN